MSRLLQRTHTSSLSWLTFSFTFPLLSSSSSLTFVPFPRSRSLFSFNGLSLALLLFLSCPFDFSLHLEHLFETVSSFSFSFLFLLLVALVLPLVAFVGPRLLHPIPLFMFPLFPYGSFFIPCFISVSFLNNFKQSFNWTTTKGSRNHASSSSFSVLLST